MKLSKSNTKCLQGIAILFMLGLHLFNRSDISNYYDVNICIGGVPLLTHISYIFDMVLCQDLVQVKMRFSSS